jgi:hypothetical protein
LQAVEQAEAPVDGLVAKASVALDRAIALRQASIDFG